MIKTNQDYHRTEGNTIVHYVNCAKYNSDTQDWHTLEELFHDPHMDFTDILFLKLTGRQPTTQDRILLSKTLLLISSGIGCHPPSVMVPKLIASTTKHEEFAIIAGLIGGLAAVGTDHLGAVTGTMRQLRKIEEATHNISLEQAVEGYVEECLSHHIKLPGFGHPVYTRDPRTQNLLEMLHLRDHGAVHIHERLAKYMHERKGIYPNIDAALGLSYTVLGFEPSHGIYLSFVARSLNMMTHILEELPKKPFSFLNEIVAMEDFDNGHKETSYRKDPKQQAA